MKVNEELKKNQNVNFKKIFNVIEKFEEFHKADKYIQNKFSDQTKDLTKKLQKRKKRVIDIYNSVVPDFEDNINNSFSNKDIIESSKSMSKLLNSSLLESKIDGTVKNISEKEHSQIKNSSSNAKIINSEYSSMEEDSCKTIPTFVNSELIINTENAESYIEAKNYLNKVEQSMEKRMTVKPSDLDISEDQIELIDDEIKEEFIKNYEKYQFEQKLEESFEEETEEEKKQLKKESQREILRFKQNGFNINNQDCLQSDLLLDSCDAFLRYQHENINEEIHKQSNFNKNEQIQISEIEMEDIPTNYLSYNNHEPSDSDKYLMSAINLKDSTNENQFYENDLDQLTISKETDLMASNLSYENEIIDEKKTFHNLTENSKFIKPIHKPLNKFEKPKKIFHENNFEEISGENEFLISTIGEGLSTLEPGVINEDIIPNYIEPINLQQFGDSLTDYQNLQQKNNLNDEEAEKFKNYYLENNFESGISVGLNYDDEIRISQELEQLNQEIEISRVSMNKSVNTIQLIEELNQKNNDSQI